MIIHSLYLAAAWFTGSLVVMLLAGTRLRHTHPAISFS
jgi:hypothetical protein